MAECRTCELWLLHDTEQEVYCGWCGSKLVGYTVTLDRQVLSLGAPQATVRLTIQNLGHTPLQITDITPDRPWVEVPNIQGLVLEANGVPLELPLAIRHALIPAQVAQTAHISVATASALAPEQVTLQVVPPPQLRIEVQDYPVLLDDTDSMPHTGRLILESGYAQIISLSADMPWVTMVEHKGQTWPCQLGGEQARELVFDLVVDKAALRAHLRQTGGNASGQGLTLPVQVEVLCHNPEQVLSTVVQVVCTWPPVLEVRGRQGEAPLIWQGFTGKKRPFTLVIENRGGSPLILEHVAIEPALPWLQLPAQNLLPMRIPPQQTGSLPFAVDGTQISTGTYTFACSLLSNSYPVTQRSIPVQLMLEEMPVYDGVVAFDFGTTNSCVVVCDRDRWLARIIPLDQPSTSFMPTVIRYEALLEGQQKEYRVGSYAKALAHVSWESTVQFVKRRLGSSTRLPVRFFYSKQKQEYAPEDIAYDIVKSMLEQVEEYLGCQVTECVLTHPSTFSPLQLQSLRSVFTACGVSVNLMIHEPIAAAMDYILSRESSLNSYSLLVYDFGGGTVDLTLFEVEDTTGLQGHRTVTPQILGVGGKRKFGGEDVTTSIMKELARHLNDVVERQHGIAALLRTDVEEISRLADEETRRIAFENYGIVWSIAEDIKIELSNNPFSDDKAHSKFVTIAVPQQSESINIETHEISGNDLNTLIQHELDDIMQLIEMMLRKADKQYPDIILLSGQSSRLRLVQETLEARFPTSTTRLIWADGQEIHTADNLQDGLQDALKLCVARGACRMAWLLDIPGPLTLNAMQLQERSTARIGITSTTTQGNPCFRTVIDAGEPVETWYPVQKLARLRRRSPITVLENTGSRDELDSPDIQRLGTFRLGDGLPQALTDNMLEDATLMMRLTQHHEVELQLQVDDQTYPCFTTARWRNASS